MVTFGGLLDLKTRYDEWKPRADVNRCNGTEHAKQIIDLFKVQQPFRPNQVSADRVAQFFALLDEDFFQ